MYHKKQKGFTLAELLIVIAIISILAAIVLVSLNDSREKARESKAEADLKQIQTAIEKARIQEGKVLMDITGSGCSNCACRDACDYQCDACRQSMENAMKALGFNGALVDPWGKYYGIDENEDEFSSDPCRADRVIANGYKTIIIPFSLPECT